MFPSNRVAKCLADGSDNEGTSMEPTRRYPQRQRVERPKRYRDKFNAIEVHSAPLEGKQLLIHKKKDMQVQTENAATTDDELNYQTIINGLQNDAVKRLQELRAARQQIEELKFDVATYRGMWMMEAQYNKAAAALRT